MEEVEVVVAHNERTTLRVGDVFLKIDGDQRRADAEVEAMGLVDEDRARRSRNPSVCPEAIYSRQFPPSAR